MKERGVLDFSDLKKQLTIEGRVKLEDGDKINSQLVKKECFPSGIKENQKLHNLRTELNDLKTKWAHAQSLIKLEFDQRNCDDNINIKTEAERQCRIHKNHENFKTKVKQETEETVDKLETEISKNRKLQNKNRNLEHKIQFLEQDKINYLRKTENCIKNLETEIRCGVVDCTLAKSREHVTQQQCNDAIGKFLTADKQLESARQKLTWAYTEIDQLQSKYEYVKKRENFAIGELDDKIKENERYHAETVREFRLSLKKSDTEIEKLNKEWIKKDDRLKSANTKLNSYDKKLKQAECKINHFSDKNRELELKMKKGDQTVKELNARVRELSTARNKSRTERNKERIDTQKLIFELNGKIKTLGQENSVKMEHLKSGLKQFYEKRLKEKLAAQLEEHKNETTELKTCGLNLTEQYCNLQKENEWNKSKLKWCTVELNGHKIEHQEILKKVVELKKCVKICRLEKSYKLKRIKSDLAKKISKKRASGKNGKFVKIEQHMKKVRKLEIINKIKQEAVSNNDYVDKTAEAEKTQLPRSPIVFNLKNEPIICAKLLKIKLEAFGQ